MGKRNTFAAFLSFDGRTRRLDWWLIGIGLSLIQALLGAVLPRLIFGVWPSLQQTDIPTGAAVLRLAIMLLFLWPLMALSVRRAHDRNKSGWLVLLISALGVIDAVALIVAPDLVFFSMGPQPSAVALARYVFDAVYVIISLWLFITLGFLDGTPGPNRYGQSPKGVGQKNYQAPRTD